MSQYVVFRVGWKHRVPSYNVTQKQISDIMSQAGKDNQEAIRMVLTPAFSDYYGPLDGAVTICDLTTGPAPMDIDPP